MNLYKASENSVMRHVLNDDPHPDDSHAGPKSAASLLRASVKHVICMKSFWILTLSAGARQFSGNVFGYYMPSYLSSTYPSAPNLLSHYGIIVGVVGSVAVLTGGVICSSLPRIRLMALYLTAGGGMLSSAFVICMVFSRDLASGSQSAGLPILYGTMSAACMQTLISHLSEEKC